MRKVFEEVKSLWKLQKTLRTVSLAKGLLHIRNLQHTCIPDGFVSDQTEPSNESKPPQLMLKDTFDLEGHSIHTLQSNNTCQQDMRRKWTAGVVSSASDKSRRPQMQHTRHNIKVAMLPDLERVGVGAEGLVQGLCAGARPGAGPVLALALTHVAARLARVRVAGLALGARRRDVNLRGTASGIGRAALTLQLQKDQRP